MRTWHSFAAYFVITTMIAACGSDDGGESDAPTCQEVCDHGRSLGCEKCLEDDCVSECEANLPPEVRQRDVETEDCRVDFGGDTAAQCDAP